MTFRSLDTDDKGYVLEQDFRKLLTGKAGISSEDIDEMISGYKGKVAGKKVEALVGKDVVEDVIYYQEFVNLLQS